MISFHRIITSLPHLFRGAIVSLEIAGIALIIGVIIGTFCGLMLHRNKPGSWIIYTYVTLLRGTPMLIQITFFYYALAIAGVQLSAFMCATIAIGLNSSAYITEIIRSGIASVDQGQIEAAHTLGIPQQDITRFILLPQAFQTILPALGNEVITLVKDSSLASVVGVMELYNQGRMIISTTYDAMSLYIAIALVYIIITTTLSYLLMYLEQRLQRVC